jgi:integrase/recombinase XerD
VSAAYLRGRMYYCHVPLEDGRTRVRKAGTTDRATARAIDRMLEVLKGKRDWELLHAAAFGDLGVGELWDAYRGGEAALALLRARLNDVDLAEHVGAWLSWLYAQLGDDSPTPGVYRRYIRSLIPEAPEDGAGGGTLPRMDARGPYRPAAPFYRSELTTERLMTWLAALPVSSGTRRSYHTGVSSFFKYLKLVGLVERNPMRDVDAPPANPAREQYLEHADVLRLVDAQPEPYRTLSALIHGAGLELTVALALTRADVEMDRRRVRARGRKMRRRQAKRARDRYARVEAWAWAYVERHVRTLLPGAPLFPGISTKMARLRHNQALARLGLTDYHPHDARHTYAVRALRAGASPRVVSKQLGHVDEQMVMRVYGKHEPDDTDYDWEQRAAAKDAVRDAPRDAARPQAAPTTNPTDAPPAREAK